MADYAEYIRELGNNAVKQFRSGGNKENVLRVLTHQLQIQPDYSDKFMSASSRQKAAEILFISCQRRSKPAESRA